MAAYDGAGGPDHGVAFVAVGGYGRRELAPYSDLDLVLVHDDQVDPGALAEKVWYPLWDAGVRLDHSVRSLSQMVTTSEDDLRVALGLLDVRHLAGDPNLTLRLRTTMLAAWRRQAPERLPALRELVRSRHERVGELAHLSVPDLKEAEGGLRDTTVLKALVATWLVDVPHADLERSRQALLDVRDLLHEASGRPTDRIGPESWAELAEPLGLDDAVAVQTHVRELGRRITHLSRLTWRRVDAYLARPASRPGSRGPGLVPIAAGVALASGEVVLDAGARPDQDPVLLLRAAAEAAERDVVLAPATAARLVREAAPLAGAVAGRGAPAAGPAAGVGARAAATSGRRWRRPGPSSLVLPEWERIRLLPHASPIHRFTVDRHVVETCREAAGLIRSVRRPDVLMVAALLHDIGKGGLTEHSVAGEPIARRIATRMGFDDEGVDLIALLVRWHLLLAETATTRDPDDPATLSASRRGSAPRRRSPCWSRSPRPTPEPPRPQAWSRWRAGLVLQVGHAALATLAPGAALPAPAPMAAGPVEVKIPRAVRKGGVGIEVRRDRARLAGHRRRP